MIFEKSKSTGVIEVYIGKRMHLATITPDCKTEKCTITYPNDKSKHLQDNEVQAMGLLLDAAVRISDQIITACESDEPRIKYIP